MKYECMTRHLGWNQEMLASFMGADAEVSPTSSSQIFKKYQS
jgi:hypothetical protein